MAASRGRRTEFLLDVAAHSRAHELRVDHHVPLHKGDPESGGLHPAAAPALRYAGVSAVNDVLYVGGYRRVRADAVPMRDPRWVGYGDDSAR